MPVETAPAGTESIAARVVQLARRRGLATDALLWPLLVFFVLFYLVPVLLLLYIGFNPPNELTNRPQSTVTLENFADIATAGPYLKALGWALGLAAAVTVISLVVGFFPAYVIARSREATTGLILLTLALLPLQVDVIIRVYGLIVLLGTNGFANQALSDLGIVDSPVPFIYNVSGDLIGMTQLALPFVILLLSAALRQVDPALQDTAHSLGAGWWTAMRTVVLPLATPGIIAAGLLAFSLTLGNYLVPVVLGNLKPITTTIQLNQEISFLGQWQRAAALAALMIVPCTALMGAFYVSFRRLMRNAQAA